MCCVPFESNKCLELLTYSKMWIDILLLCLLMHKSSKNVYLQAMKVRQH
jgi:hypothetical protein